MTTNTNGGGSGRPTIPPKPHALQPIPENIPNELKTNTRFVMWAWEYRNGKQHTPGRWTKPPYTTVGEAAAVDDPSTWTDFETALAAYRGERAFDGLGWVLQEEDGYTGIDLDKCVDEDGTIAAWAQKVIQALNSYTEISPSGTGIRIIVRGTLPPGRRRKGLVEMYISGRYLTLTGHRVEGAPATIEERSEAVAALHLEVFGEAKPPQTTTVGERPALSLDDAEVLERARGGKHGARFIALYDHGDWQGQGYDSQNEADAALCNDLRFWTGADLEQMDRLFRRSGLMREKWDERRGELTYGEKTITFTLNGATYTPGGPRPAPAATTARSGCGPADAKDEIIATQAARIAELEAIVARQHRVITGAVAILEADMKPDAKVIQMGIAFRQHKGFGIDRPAAGDETAELTAFFVHQPTEVERLHVSADAIQSVMDAATTEGAAFTKTAETLRCSPFTGELTDQPHSYVAYVPAHDDLGETLHAIAATVPACLKKHKRQVKPRPQPEAKAPPVAAPPCPDHPGAETDRRGEHAIVARCTSCGLATQAVLLRDHAVLRPIPATSGRGNTLTHTVVTGSSTADARGGGDGSRCTRCRGKPRLGDLAICQSCRADDIVLGRA